MRLHRHISISGLYPAGGAAIAPETKAAPAIVNSPYACAIDVTNDWVLYDRAAYLVWPWPASTVKMMTMLLTAELKGGNLSETVTWQTSDDLSSNYSQVGFGNGDVVTWTDLLHGMLLVSGGDACQAAARVLGNEDMGNPLTSTDGYARFTTMMNAKAKALGCDSVAFINAHGADNHSMSAADLARIAGACFSNAVMDAMGRTGSYAINVTGANARTINLSNANPMISATGVIGSKTGSLTGSGDWPSDTYNLGTLWQAPGGQKVAVVNMYGASSAARYDDTTAMIAALPTDFPYLDP